MYMQKILMFFRAHWIRISLGFFILLIAGIAFYRDKNAVPEWITTKVERGTVSNTISVSGTMNAVESAELAFPVSGILETIDVTEGTEVVKGTTLATLKHRELIAEYEDATASLLIAQADQQEMIAGLRPEEVTIANTRVAIATEDLARAKRVYDEKVVNTYRTLLSTDLVAQPTNKNSDAVPPTITGTYQCAEGMYTLDVFRSNANSGYSYRLSGIENGTYTAYTETSGPLGDCGLFIQFDANASYGNSTWTITIPNTESASYVTNQNAYALAQVERDNAVESAKQDLLLAQKTQTLDTANPRIEELARGEARVMQAKARAEKVRAQIAEHILTAPFDGTITNIAPVPGETVGPEPVVTMISKAVFELTALIPEIDVTKVQAGQRARVVFDARTSETLDAHITFISPLAREIGGVSYFETTLILDTNTTWLQSGLNADIDIIIDTHENVTRVGKRFIIRESDASFVLVPNGRETSRVPVTVLFEGNDGYVEVGGVTEGDTIVAP